FEDRERRSHDQVRFLSDATPAPVNTPSEGAAESAPAQIDAPVAHAHSHDATWKLAIGAIGIVFGDIGTSPLYAFRETFDGHHKLAL
ncbi:KUP/HAK/KT family potassium transporter, partial [Klebsiella aerogenes]|uniref:KUP/HAK/KT family potassium transporter n=1 Tax=Klebsiella aerogenes TaxID=548 RepID=UPI00195445E1